jgi:crotonobetainyl-CoA:carnitine CoA-transferase CaiB-like acyl-CoA transferase
VGSTGDRVSGAGPLEGLVVVDFSRIVSGPFSTQILGDLGADVIKVERVGVGEDARPYGVTDPSRMPGATFLAMNRNKRSVGIDLHLPTGKEVAKRLLRTADVALHNFRPGVMERLGLDYASVSEENPGIVYCSISGFGDVGPQRESAANDLAIQAYSGLLSITGEANGPPVRNPAPVCDMTAGLYGTIGILAALFHRQATGLGQEVQTNMLEGQLNMLNYMFVDYMLNGVIPVRMGTANRMGLPNQAFPSSDGWLCIVAANDRAFSKCCEALDVPSLASDPRFNTLTGRYAHRAELDAAVAEATLHFTTAECLARLNRAGVPCAPVNTLMEVTEDPQLEALGSLVEMPVGQLGPVKLVKSPLHLSRTPITTRLPPPELGSHTDGILAGAGYSAREIAALRAEGAVC